MRYFDFIWSGQTNPSECLINHKVFSFFVRNLLRYSNFCYFSEISKYCTQHCCILRIVPRHTVSSMYCIPQILLVQIYSKIYINSTYSFKTHSFILCVFSVYSMYCTVSNCILSENCMLNFTLHIPRRHSKKTRKHFFFNGWV